MTTEAMPDTLLQGGEESAVDKAKLAEMIDTAFADLYAYIPDPSGPSMLKKEPFLLQAIQEEFILPPNDDVKIEDLTEEDMRLPDGFL
ncbi:hypothetical protein V8J88_15025 [Massilia sp. W12]|uniref:hypothetical protein n=1 Tax=Massilia sp. W12 TaxID=3126507 RepID=UPI0030D5271B